MALQEIEMQQDNGPVGAGGSAPRYITASDGSHWVAKATYFGGQPHRYLYLNEAVCNMVADRIGVAVPTPAVLRLTPEQAEVFKPGHQEADRIIFASTRIEPAEALSPEAVRATLAETRAGIVVFDALVWNTDDKPEHVVAERRDEGWQLWPVDHGHCLAVADTLQSLPTVDAPYNVFQLLADGVQKAHLAPWIERAREVEAEEFAEMVRSLPAEWVIETDAPERLAAALEKRAATLEQVLYPVFP